METQSVSGMYKGEIHGMVVQWLIYLGSFERSSGILSGAAPIGFVLYMSGGLKAKQRPLWRYIKTNFTNDPRPKKVAP